MSVPDTENYYFSDICNEIYGSTNTNGKYLMQCFADANGSFDSRYNPNSLGNKNNFLNFRNYNHTTKFITYTVTDTNPIQQGFLVNLYCGNFWYVNDRFTNTLGYVSNGINGTYNLNVSTTDDSKYEAFNVVIKKDGVVIFNSDDSGSSVSTTFQVDYGHYYEIIITSRNSQPTSVRIYVNYTNSDGDGSCRIVIDGVTSYIIGNSTFNIPIGSSFYVACTSPSSSGCEIVYQYTGDTWTGAKNASGSVLTAVIGMDNSTFNVTTGTYI